jgi:hypothetical protein
MHGDSRFCQIFALFIGAQRTVASDMKGDARLTLRHARAAASAACVGRLDRQQWAVSEPATHRLRSVWGLAVQVVANHHFHILKRSKIMEEDWVGYSGIFLRNGIDINRIRISFSKPHQTSRGDFICALTFDRNRLTERGPVTEGQSLEMLPTRH